MDFLTKHSRSNPSELTPSLFDDIPAAAPDAPAEDVAVVDELDDWQDVPHARFLSWSNAMQLHYCWRRDLDSALRAETPHEATFFLQRAESYKHALDELKAQ